MLREQVEFRAHKAAPRDANRRGHGPTGVHLMDKPDPTAEEVRRAYEAGTPLVPLAERYGRSVGWVRRRVASAGGTIRSHRQPRVTRTCLTCGETFEAKQYEEDRRGGVKFCSRACWTPQPADPAKLQRQADAASRNHTGAGNPNFRSGKYVGSHVRRSLFSLEIKGETACRVCGATDRQLHLHHAVPRSMSEEGSTAILNGITLCGSCHSSWHHQGRTVIYRDLFTAEEWAFICSLPTPSGWLDERYPMRDEGQAPVRS